MAYKTINAQTQEEERPRKRLRTLFRESFPCACGKAAGLGEERGAAPLVRDIVRANSAAFKEDLVTVAKQEAVERAIRNEHVARRYQKLLDVIDTGL